MKALLVAVLFVSAAAQAEDVIVDRSQRTGSEAVVSTGACNFPTVDSQGTADVTDDTVSSSFSYSVCVETKVFKAKKITNNEKTWNKTSYEPIPGTERMVYSLETRTNGDTRLAGDNPTLTTLQSMAACGNLKSTMSRAVVDVRNTGCGRQ